MGKKTEPTRKPDGRYLRDIGWKPKAGGGVEQHRFYLGRDRADAMLRSLQLEKVWDGVERRWERLGRPTERPLWDDITMQIAQAVARGEPVAKLDLFGRPQVMDDEGGGYLALKRLQDLQPDFPSIRLELADARLQAAIPAAEEMEREFDRRLAGKGAARDAVLAALDERPVPTSGHRLHTALDGYGEWIKGNYLAPGGQGKLTQHGVTMLTYVGLLKEHQADMPLDCFGLAEIEAMLSYWRHRPMSKKGRPVAVDTAKDMIKRIRHFVRWLHKSPFRWKKPADLESEPIRVAMTHEEMSARMSPEQVETYTLDELCLLYEYATPWERLLMLLGLNCGFGQAEVVTLLTSEIKLRQHHDYYKREGSFIKRLRHKSVVYGEWSLWDATVKGIEWQMARRGKTEHKALLLTRTGRPLSGPTKGNNRNSKIPRAWAHLLDRIRKDHPQARGLSFNKLRKTAGNLVRRFSDGETAGIFHCRGTPVKSDDLLDLYTNRPYDKVFAALDRVAEYLSPMFIEVPVPFPAADAPQERPALSKGTIKRIRQLRQQGYTLRKIGEVLGIPPETARRYCKGRPAGKADNQET